MAWPLIERELRVASRKHRIRNLRLWGTVIGVGVTMLFLLFGMGGSGGRTLRGMLFAAGIFIILRVPEYTVGIFAEERRNDTLGLLFLCGIGPMELFLCKTLGAALAAFNSLLMLYPFLAISFLGGGYSWDLLMSTVWGLPLALLFVFSVSVLASVLCREESTALFTATAIGAVLCVIPYALQAGRVGFAYGSGFPNGWLSFSPAGFLYMIGMGRRIATEEFWTGCCVMVGWSALFLFIAGYILNRIWQDKPETLAPRSLRARTRVAMHGDVAGRRRLAQRWLDKNPFVWLAARDLWLPNLSWLIMGGLILLWVAGLALWRENWPIVISFFALAILLNILLSMATVFVAAKTIGENRRSGGLELLLTTPLTEAEIVKGQRTALHEQFKPLALTILFVEMGMFAIGLLSRPWGSAAFGIYLVVWLALGFWTCMYLGKYRGSFRVMWDALVSGRPAYVALRASGLAKSPFWIGYMIFWFSRFFRGMTGHKLDAFPTGSVGEIVFCVVGVLIAFVTVTLSFQKREEIEKRLLGQFRRVASQPPPEPSDPRFKNWASGEPFPDSQV